MNIIFEKRNITNKLKAITVLYLMCYQLLFLQSLAYLEVQMTAMNLV